MLSDLEQDAIAELFNIGMGESARTLSEMTQQEVILSAPRLQFCSVDEAIASIGASVGQRICGISQAFSGNFSSEAILVFPEERSLEIVRTIVGQDIPLHAMTDMAQDAMCEVGNVILNSCIGAVANVFGSEMISTLPRLKLGPVAEVVAAGEVDAAKTVLLLHIEFSLSQNEITGYIIFILDIPSIAELQRSVQAYLAQNGLA